MCIALVGGMDKLKKNYQRAADEYCVDLHHFERDCPRLEDRLSGMDAIVIFTYRVSHNARGKAMSKGEVDGIPVFMCRSSGSISSLRRCMDEITKERGIV